MKKTLRLVSFTTVAVLFLLTGCGNTESARTEDLRNLTEAEYTVYSLSGTDSLGRSFSAIDGEKEGKYVGVFYFLWCGAHSTNPYSVTYLLENDPDALWATTGSDNYNAEMSRTGLYHYWGEPLYGYYHQMDPWVVSRHIEMFINASVDFLALDTTNGVTYDAQVYLLLETLLKYQQQGFKVPQVMFMTKTNDINTVSYLYDKWYENDEYGDRYDDLWFAPGGKPMISTTPYGWTNDDWSDDQNAEYTAVRDYFDIKYNQWPDETTNPNGFAWMEFTYPQPVHKKSRMINVSVAQHTSSKMSNQSQNRGRSFNYSTVNNEEERYAEGLNYQGQWDTVFTTEDAEYIDIVFITGWNEWIAGKYETGSKGEVYFVDTFNINYSRDIEPMKDGFGDNYYMQTIENIRAYKSTGSTSYKMQEYTVNVNDFSSWNDVPYVYRDLEGDAMARDYNGSIAGIYYEDHSNRNDIVVTKVAYDADYLYFYVETAEDITPYEGGTNWMNLLLSLNDGESGFEGYDYLINAAPNGNRTSVSRFTGDGFSYTSVGEADLSVSGNKMAVRVKRSALGLENSDVPMFSFKVCDNVQSQGDIMDYYVSGDCAPLGRVNYTFGY